MKNDDEDFVLTQDDWELINSVVHPQKMTLEKALQSSDPLGNINNNLSGKTKAQKTFRLLYAAILEVNSVGVPILFDRFTKREIETIYQKYSELKARKICSTIDTLKKVINKNLGANPSNNKISNYFNSAHIPNEIKLIYRKNRDIVNEMEKKLLAYATDSIAELKE